MVDYLLIRSNRKTIGIYIKDGGVEVRAPFRASKAEIERFICLKEKWIKVNLERSVLLKEAKGRFEPDYGGRLLYRGKEYPIVAKGGKRAGFEETDVDNMHFYVPAGLNSEQVKAACIRTYKALAKRVLIDKTMAYAKRMNVTPCAVKINSAKGRWGSCSSVGCTGGLKNINYSWRLITVDDFAMDYVIVHELAHITQMNHSTGFWELVESVLPDYKERKARLKAQGAMLCTL
ncbi:MAG: M48 family metallopeptidase [Oscillospiraceae bacterium]|nr:M48 family metallopeptidase [Oscillospiraceae bacterium]